MSETTPSQVSRKVGGGRFTLVKPVGRGGMGVVWLAQDARLNETVALKSTTEKCKKRGLLQGLEY